MLNSRDYRKVQLRYKVCDLIEAIGGPGTAARYLDVTIDTVQRWLDHKTFPTRAVFLALQVAHGRHPFMLNSHTWDGFRFTDDGKLWSDQAYQPFSGADLLNSYRLYHLNEALHRRVKLLEGQIEKLHEELKGYDVAANERVFIG